MMVRYSPALIFTQNGWTFLPDQKQKDGRQFYDAKSNVAVSITPLNHA